jgi:hypothetical protein
MVLVLFALVTAVSVTALTAVAAVARPWLGVYTQEITADLRDGLDLRDNDSGVLVNRVVDGSPADRAGLRNGDLIIRFNSRSVESPEALATLVGDARNGQDIALEIVRRGDRQTLSVTLAPRPSDEDGESLAPPTPPAAPRAPRAPRDIDDDRDDGPRHKARVRVITPDGGHGTPHVYRFDGDLDKIPGDVRRMLGDMHIREFDGGDNGDGSRRIVIRPGSRLRLGVRVEALSDDLGTALDVPGGDGVLVMQVYEDTPAARAGIRAGDVILSVNDHGVKNAEELQKALREANGKVSLSVSRKGSRRTVEAELGSPSWTSRGSDDDSPGPGRMEGLERLGRLRALEGVGGDDLRKQLDELRQQVRELRQQLEEQRDHH